MTSCWSSCILSLGGTGVLKTVQEKMLLLIWTWPATMTTVVFPVTITTDQVWATCPLWFWKHQWGSAWVAAGQQSPCSTEVYHQEPSQVLSTYLKDHFTISLATMKNLSCNNGWSNNFYLFVPPGWLNRLPVGWGHFLLQSCLSYLKCVLP